MIQCNRFSAHEERRFRNSDQLFLSIVNEDMNFAVVVASQNTHSFGGSETLPSPVPFRSGEPDTLGKMILFGDQKALLY